MRSSIFAGLIFMVFILTFQGCKCKREKQQPKITEAEKIEVQHKLNVQRFEKDLFAIGVDSIKEKLPQLKLKYGEFIDMFNYKIISLGSSNDPQYPDLLKRFLTDYFIKLNYNRVKKVYPNIDDIVLQLTNAFGLYGKYFPEKRIPHVYTCISGWNESIFTADTILTIALDKYLGRQCEYYEKLRLTGNEGFAKYMCYTMQREYIASDCIRAWGSVVFEFSDSVTDNVLNNMLYEGKILYFVKEMMPDEPDTIVFGFTPDQLKWCNENAKQVWTYLVEHKLLFSTDYMTIRKLIYPAPFTSFFSQESPGRATVWLGYKIIEAYMKNNQDITLRHLMYNKEYQKILRLSKFKP
jgi:hypothetical protein